MWIHDATEVAYNNGFDKGYMVGLHEEKNATLSENASNETADKFKVYKSLLKAKSDAELDVIIQDLGSDALREQVKMLVGAYNAMVIAVQINGKDMIEKLKSNSMDTKCCLFCNHSMSGDAPDGTEVLVCFECEDYEGKEMIVGEDECCANFD